jgi:hypothetical protein
MSATLTLPFDNSANFIFDINKIEFLAGVAQLKLKNNTGLEFEQQFTNDTGFTYDSDKAEFAGGKVQQKNQFPNATFGANYNVDINGTFGDGTLTGVATGGASISGNKLDLTGNTTKHVTYDASLNADSQQQGTIRFKFTPDYNGVPPTNMNLFSISKQDASTINSIALQHKQTTGALRLLMVDYLDSTIIDVDLGTLSAVSGTEYEICICFDITAGATRLFVNGNQSGTTQTATGTRDSNISLLRVGNNVGGVGLSDFYIDDFIFYDTVLFTSNYTPGYTLVNKYVESKIDLPQFSYTQIGNVQSFDDFTVIETGLPKYIINGNYWNGSIWTSSNGSYAQANTATEVLTNISLISATDTLDVSVVFTDTNAQSNVDNLIMEYTGQDYPSDNPTIEIAQI